MVRKMVRSTCQRRGARKTKDVDSINYWNEMNKNCPNHEKMLRKALSALSNRGRDNARNTMQWNTWRHAGFTIGTPWMRAHDNYPEVKVEAAQRDANSIYRFWRNMFKVRKEHSGIFIEDGYKVYDLDDPYTFTFTKTTNRASRALVMLNFSHKEQQDPIPQSLKNKKSDLLITNSDDKSRSLGAWEGAVANILMLCY